MSRVTIKHLEWFVSTHNFDDKPFQLDKGTTITNKKLFTQSHLRYLLANTGNTLFMPYYNRLVKLYKHENNEQ